MTASPWTSLEIVKLAVSVLTPVTVLLFGDWFNRRLKTIELDRAKYSEDRQNRAEEYKREVERLYTPHLELSITCEFFGPVEGRFLAHFTLMAINRGRVMHRFRSIRLRVRGIGRGDCLAQWEGRKPRAFFPHKVFEAELVPSDWRFIYVEPGVAHPIGFTATVDAAYSFLLAHVEFHLDPVTPHNVERVFALPAV